MKRFHANTWPVLAFIVVALLGGLNTIGIHFTVLELPPFWGATLRFGPAGILQFLLAAILRIPFPRRRALLGAILFGALNFGGSYAFIYYGMEKVQPGMSQVILAIVPLFTFLFAVAQRQETFRWRGLAGALLALAGILIVFWEEVQTKIPLTSLLAMVMGAICIAESSVLIKFFPKAHPVHTNAIGLSVGAIILFLFSRLGKEKLLLPVRTSTWVALSLLILLGSCVLFLLVLTLLKLWPASTVSYGFVIFPFVSVTASAWLTHEVLNPILLVGAAFVLVGAVTGILEPARKGPVRRDGAELQETGPQAGMGGIKGATSFTAEVEAVRLSAMQPVPEPGCQD